jgi:hypothetical protein
MWGALPEVMLEMPHSLTYDDGGFGIALSVAKGLGKVLGVLVLRTAVDVHAHTDSV